MKKLLILTQIFCLFLLCGCSDTSELGNDDIITVFYVDYNEEIYEISAEILDFENDEKAVIKTAYGDSISLAYSNLLKSLEKPPYIGHTNAIILGDGIAINSPGETLRFFSDINIISPNIDVMMSEDDLGDFKPLSIYSLSEDKTFPHLPIYTLFIPENKTVFIPVISSYENEPKTTGGIIMEDFEFSYYITEKESGIYKLLNNSFKENYYGSYEILKSKCKIKNDSGILQISLNLEIKNHTEKKNKKISEKIKNDIEYFTEKLREKGLCNLLKKGEFKSVKTYVEITVSDTGKLKKKEK